MEDQLTKDDIIFLIPEDEEEPYFFNSDIVRRDIKEDRQGLPLKFSVKVIDINGDPFSNAFVEIWHADNNGTVSGTSDAIGETFLRGIQLTNDLGIVTFNTIYPGVIADEKTPYINVKVRLNLKFFVTTKIYLPDYSSLDKFGEINSIIQIGDSEEYNMEPDAPTGFGFHDIEPHPVNDRVQISYELENSGLVIIDIFNSMNEKVETILEGHQSLGIHMVSYKTDHLPVGFYTVKMSLNNESAAKEIIIYR